MLDVIATVRRDQENLTDTNDYKKRIEYLMVQLNITNFRINVGKWDASEFGTLIEDVSIIRSIASDYLKKVNVILDIPFPGKKTRVVTYAVKIGIKIRKGVKYRIYSANEMELGKLISSDTSLKENSFFGVSISDIGNRVMVEDDILYGDGQGHFKVKSIESTNCIVVVALNNFELNNAKSIHFKNSVEINDLDDSVVRLIQNIRPDTIALSFAENTEDIMKIKENLLKNNLDCKIMAKIETQKGIDNIASLLEIVDSIMVGRGDLGLHLGIEEFPEAVDKIIQKTKKMNKYVCVATGFMDTYVHQTIPSRSDTMDLYRTVKSPADGIVFTYNTVRDYYKITGIVALINKWE